MQKPPNNLTRQLSDGFFLRLADAFVNRLGTDPHFVLAVMAHESGLRPEAANPARPGAYGLIQFYGDDKAYVASMSAEDQVPLIEAHFAPHAPYGSIGEVYGQNYLPGRMADRGRSPGTILSERGEAFYDQNPSLDFNHDDAVTIDDLEQTARAAARGMGAKFAQASARLDWAITELGLGRKIPGPSRGAFWGTLAFVAAAAGGLYWYQSRGGALPAPVARVEKWFAKTVEKIT